MDFETAIKDLELIVRKLENGDASLEEAIAHYEKGAQLEKVCREKLKAAELKIEQIVKKSDGDITTEPTEI